MRKIVALLVLLVAGLAIAASMPPGELKVESDGMLPIGAAEIEVIADGEAQITVYSSQFGAVTVSPYDSNGDAYYTLVSGAPREFGGVGRIDSVDVTLVDATYVILTWR